MKTGIEAVKANALISVKRTDDRFNQRSAMNHPILIKRQE
jgi:hypothetical protein